VAIFQGIRVVKEVEVVALALAMPSSTRKKASSKRKAAEAVRGPVPLGVAWPHTVEEINPIS